MAGAFGFEREHYDVAMACGERVLLPAVRGTSDDTLVIADGFSCREQIAQSTTRRALHLAEVLQLALHQDSHGAASGEEGSPEHPQPSRHGTIAALVGAGAIVGSVVWRLTRRKP
jgi:hypothetical protein